MPDYVNRHKASKGPPLKVFLAAIVLAALICVGVFVVWAALEAIAPAGTAPVARAARVRDLPALREAPPGYSAPYAGGQARPQ